MPDIAFIIGPLKEYAQMFKEVEKVDILYILRSDKEGYYSKKRTDKYLQELLERENLQLTFKSLDWFDRILFKKPMKFPEGSFDLSFYLDKNKTYDFQEKFLTAIAMFSSAKVIISDMLHATIFSFLQHKPHVVLDNNFGKSTETRKVAFSSSPYCQDEDKMRFRRAENLEEASHLANELLKIVYGQ